MVASGTGQQCHMLSLVGLALAANGVAAGLGMKRWYIGVVIVGLLLLIGGADLD